MTISRDLEKQGEGASTEVSRRDLLAGVGAGVLTSMVAAQGAFAAEGHDHSKHAPQNPDLLDVLERCNSAGRLCIAHCLVSFQEGDTSLAKCAAKVHEMVAVCGAMETLVGRNSSYVSSMSDACVEVCRDCAAECKKHADTHSECRACMEACEAVVAALSKD